MQGEMSEKREINSEWMRKEGNEAKRNMEIIQNGIEETENRISIPFSLQREEGNFKYLVIYN